MPATGWGQYDSDRIYRLLKETDCSRFFISTSGWFAQRESDVQSEHIYFKSRVLDGTQPGKFLFLSDVEGKTNGLYTYDRAVRKAAADTMLEIAERVTEARY